MTHGILSIVAYPMLKDELVYNLAEDLESKDVYVPESRTPVPSNASSRLEASPSVI